MFKYLLQYLSRLFQRKDKIEEIKEIDYISDIDLEKESLSRKRNLSIFEAIVGDTSMKQIDWIIANGFEKYNYWYSCYEKRTLYSPATVKEAPKIELPKEIETSYEQHFIRGGRGNARLIGWSYTNDTHDEISKRIKEAEKRIKILHKETEQLELKIEQLENQIYTK